jgi:hypothetical protein
MPQSTTVALRRRGGAWDAALPGVARSGEVPLGAARGGATSAASQRLRRDERATGVCGSVGFGPRADLRVGIGSRREVTWLAGRCGRFGPVVAVGTAASLASRRMRVGGDRAVVGRGGELDRLSEWAGRAVWGAPARLVLEGEAGIGKTVLWNRGVEVARAAGTRVLVTSASASERDLAFEGLADVADGFAGAVVAGLATDQRGALAAAVSRSEGPHPVADELSVCLAVLEVLRGMSAIGPLVVAVDDIQWLDEPTARVLAYALRRLNGRVGLLAAARAGADGPGLLVLEGVAVERLTVGALGPAAIDALLGARLGRRFTNRRHGSRRPHATGVAARVGGPLPAITCMRAKVPARAHRGVRKALCLRSRGQWCRNDRCAPLGARTCSQGAADRRLMSPPAGDEFGRMRESRCHVERVRGPTSEGR